jgi:hypothetical protein
MAEKSIKELEDEADKYFKSAKRWENVAKNTERAEKALDVAGLFTGGGALVGGAKILGKKLLKKKLKKGFKDSDVTVKLKPSQIRTVPVRVALKPSQIRTAPLATPYSTQTRAPFRPPKRMLPEIFKKGAAGTALEIATNIDTPIGFEELFRATEAQAPGNNPPKSVLKKEILRRKYKSSKP